jgi:hypothetical protein
MAAPTIDEILDGQVALLAPIIGWDGNLITIQRDRDITESVMVRPLIQMYYEEAETDSSTETSMRTFGTGLQITTFRFHWDCYARQRQNVGIDLDAARQTAQSVRAQLRTQKYCPFFGVDGIEAMSWRSRRVTFEYGAKRLPYAAIRFIVDCVVYLTER